MFTHTLIRGWSAASGTQLLKRIAVSAGGEFNLDEAIPVGANQPVAFALDVSQAKSLFISADGDLTIKTNSSGAPVNTITLAAGTPFEWIFGDAPLRDTAGVAIATDITSLFVTNGGAAPVTLQLRCLVDPTI